MPKEEWEFIGKNGRLISTPLIYSCDCCGRNLEENETHLQLTHAEGTFICKECIKKTAKRLGLLR